MNNSFQTITQFIDTDDTEYNKKKYNKNACHFFALKTAYEFMKKKEGSKTTHEANIYFAINMNKLYQNHDMYFEEVIKFTNLKISDICATTTELINSGEFPIDIIFPMDSNKSYCVIILKNAKYFCVIRHGDNFYVRDCHEPFQYDFPSRNDMIAHLNKIYQFNESIVVNGYSIPEFSSIEYIMVDNPFDFKNGILENGINKDIVHEKNPEIAEQFKETEFGISIGHVDYDEIGGDNVNTNPKKSFDNINYFNNLANKNIKSNIFPIINDIKINDKTFKDTIEYKNWVDSIKDSKYEESDIDIDTGADKIPIDKYEDEEHIGTEIDEEIGGDVIIPASSN